MLGKYGLGAALFAAFASLSAQAQTQAAAPNWPSRTITIVLPLAAGSGMDTIVRLYADKLSPALGRPVVIENRLGGRQMIAASAVAKAEPDGHTLVVLTSSSLAIGPTLFKDMRVNPAKEFVPISLYVKSPFILVVNPAMPVKTAADFIAHAKAQMASPLSYTSLGPGSPQHLSMELVKSQFGVPMTHVPYTNTPQSVLDVTSGHVSGGFAEAGASLSLIREGKLRALAVSSSQELPVLPGVAPFAEAGKLPGFEAVSWHVLLAHAATPKPIVDRLHAEMKRIMADKELTKKVADMGLLPVDTPDVDGIRQYIASEQEKWGSLVRKLGLEGSQ